MTKTILTPANENSPALAVFCDFDGTFSIQDVEGSIARRYAAESRSRWHSEFENGALLPWEYKLLLFDGLVLPEDELERFLHTIEIDPGGPGLLNWCRERGIPFCIVSDGFDHNLDLLKEFHKIEFEYRANRLWLEEGKWIIEPGHPDPSCECGTGVCKRFLIEAFRDTHPSTNIVHIGNGRVSDTCGAIAADYVFAKETLAEELRHRGVPFRSFETLLDVISGLEDKESIY